MAPGLPYSAVMRVLRNGGEYLRRRELRGWLCFAGGGLAMVLVGLAVVLGYGVALFAMPAALTLAALAVPQLDRVRKGRLGERLVTDLLQRLPDDYYLVNDVVVPGSGGNLDHVVVGPCGVVVIETKRLAGRIRCYGDEWSVNGFRRASISRQANRGALALRRFLAERFPDSSSSFVQSVAVFTHPRCELKVNRARTTVVRYSELLQLLLDMGRRRRVSAPVAARIAEALAGSQAS